MCDASDAVTSTLADLGPRDALADRAGRGRRRRRPGRNGRRPRAAAHRRRSIAPTRGRAGPSPLRASARSTDRRPAASPRTGRSDAAASAPAPIAAIAGIRPERRRNSSCDERRPDLHPPGDLERARRDAASRSAAGDAPRAPPRPRPCPDRRRPSARRARGRARLPSSRAASIALPIRGRQLRRRTDDEHAVGAGEQLGVERLVRARATASPSRRRLARRAGARRSPRTVRRPRSSVPSGHAISSGDDVQRQSRRATPAARRRTSR